MKKAKKGKEHKVVKGEEIVIVGGSYEGCYGWLNKAHGNTENRCHVLLVTDDAGNYVPKLLSPENIKIRNHRATPKTLVELAFLQIPGLQKKTHEVISKLAKIAQIHDEKDLVISQLNDYIRTELTVAMKTQEKKRSGWVILANANSLFSSKRKSEVGREDKNKKGGVHHKRGEQVQYTVA